MKRDILLIKEILNAIENDLVKKGEPFELDGFDYSVIEGHLKLLESERLIDVDDKQGLDTGEKYYYDISLTFSGHDLLEALNNKKIFSKISKLKEPLKLLIPIALDLLKKWKRSLLWKNLAHYF